jgi:hypothetical protein
VTVAKKIRSRRSITPRAIGRKCGSTPNTASASAIPAGSRSPSSPASAGAPGMVTIRHRATPRMKATTWLRVTALAADAAARYRPATSRLPP